MTEEEAFHTERRTDSHATEFTPPPVDERYITTIASTVSNIVDERETRRREEESERFSALMSRVDDRERE